MKKLPEDVWVVEGFKTAVNNQNGDVIAILDLVGEPSIAIALRDHLIDELGRAILTAREDASRSKN